jgi:hypothetical protein
VETIDPSVTHEEYKTAFLTIGEKQNDLFPSFAIM